MTAKKKDSNITSADISMIEKREAYDLIMSSICNQYYAIYYVWLPQNTFVCFREEIIKTKEVVGEEGDFRTAWNTYVKNFIMPECQAEMYEFGNTSTLAERLAMYDSISKTARRKQVGWIRAEYIVTKRDKDGNAINFVLMFKCVNEEVRLEEQKNEAEFASEHDPLTGLFNRKGFERISSSEEFKYKKTGFALLDIDNFKALNDCHGHDVGDQVLIAVTDTLSRVFRDEDQLFRIGGDEIAILIYHGDEQMWEIICKKLRDVHAKLKEMFSDGLSLDVTLSAGLFFSEMGYNEKMRILADEAMYETKRNGRAGCTLIDCDHKILRTWRDEAVAIYTKNSLEYAISGMYRIEISTEQKFQSRLICGEAIKLAFGVSGNATPEDCYLIWKNGIDPEYTFTIEETIQAMLEGGQSECTYQWLHPKWGKIYVRSNGFAEKKTDCIIFTGYHHLLKDTKLIEKHDDKDLIFKALSHIYLGMYYLNLNTETFSTFQMTLSEDYLELSPMNLKETITNFIKAVVNEQDHSRMQSFMNMGTLQERLQNDDYIDCEYRSIPLKCWCRARLIPVKYDESGKLVRVLFTVSKLDTESV